MPKKMMWVEWADGAALSASRVRPGHLSPLTRDAARNLGQVTLSNAPDYAKYGQMALVATAGVALGAVVVHALSKRTSDERSVAVATAEVGQRAIAADWYPDPAFAGQWRYWDGQGWTHFVQSIHQPPMPPPGWYPDPSSARHVRYWDGQQWTGHAELRFGQHTLDSCETPVAHGALRLEGPDARVEMSRAEWEDLVRAWFTAGALEQKLWRQLTNARVIDADPTVIEAQRRLVQLSPEEAAQKIRLAIEREPSLREQLDTALLESIDRSGRSTTAPTMLPTIEGQDGRGRLPGP